MINGGRVLFCVGLSLIGFSASSQSSAELTGSDEAAVIEAAVSHLISVAAEIDSPLVINPGVLRWEERPETLEERRSLGFATLRSGLDPGDFEGMDRERLGRALTALPILKLACAPEDHCPISPVATTIQISRVKFSEDGRKAEVQIVLVAPRDRKPMTEQRGKSSVQELVASAYTDHVGWAPIAKAWRVSNVVRRWVT